MALLQQQIAAKPKPDSVLPKPTGGILGRLRRGSENEGAQKKSPPAVSAGALYKQEAQNRINNQIKNEKV